MFHPNSFPSLNMVPLSLRGKETRKSKLNKTLDDRNFFKHKSRNKRLSIS